MIFYLIIWREDFMFVSINNLTLLIFFYMLFSEFLDILHSENYFSFFEFINSIFCNVFIEFHLIEAHSRFKFIINKKRRHLNDNWNECIKCIFCHKQSICSVVLLMINVNTQITFYFLIENLALFVRFRIKCDE